MRWQQILRSHGGVWTQTQTHRKANIPPETKRDHRLVSFLDCEINSAGVWDKPSLKGGVVKKSNPEKTRPLRLAAIGFRWWEVGNLRIRLSPIGYNRFPGWVCFSYHNSNVQNPQPEEIRPSPIIYNRFPKVESLQPESQKASPKLYSPN